MIGLWWGDHGEVSFHLSSRLFVFDLERLNSNVPTFNRLFDTSVSSLVFQHLLRLIYFLSSFVRSVLWIGVLQLFYVVWDVSDERFFDKQVCKLVFIPLTNSHRLNPPI